MYTEKDESSKASHDNTEKGITPTTHVAYGNERYRFDQSDLDRVQRRLKQRHVQMFVSSCLLMRP